MKPEGNFNPALIDWQGPFGLPDFSLVAETDFAPAFEAALADHLREIETIAGNANPPDFANAIEALELAGKPLSRVCALFWVRAGAHTSDIVRQVERDIAPALSRHYCAIAQNGALFARVEALWKRRSDGGFSTEQLKVLEKHRRGFVHSGAALDEAGQRRLAAINEKLSVLCTQFGQNVQEDEAQWCLILSAEGELAGLPVFLREAMAEAARERGHVSGYAVTLSRSIIEPFLSFSARRDLRETAFSAWVSRGTGKRDNWPIIAEILKLRCEKAGILGYANYAAYKLEDTMAGTAGAVDELLSAVWRKSVAMAQDEAGILSGLIAADGLNHPLEPWDWRYYAEKERSRAFEFSEAEIKPYFQLDRIIDAAFDVAGRLFGATFHPRPDIGAWHKDVRAFEMRDSRDNVAGIFFGDYFARPTKRSGAWMSGLQTAHRIDGGQLPFIYNVMNFAKGAAGSPSLLSLDDARTLFHEFGHALHGLLSRATYPSVSGTSVARDFVELPSQLFEHWLFVPEILEKYAVHHRTGKPLPAETIARIKSAEKFNSGFQTVEFTACALVDMAYHTQSEIPDPGEFEAATLTRLGMPAAIVMRHRSPHFAHIFAGDGYSAGYYAYMWSEVLDADAFRAFTETGNPFDPKTAARLLEHIYAAGGTLDPDKAYLAFRGRLPTPQAMMEGRGLA
jgi:peptidyl-dipeptidase Dcp